MKSKKRLTRKDPKYFVPLPYAMAIKRGLPEAVFEHCLFDGMQLGLQVEGVINKSIAITAHFHGEDHVIGHVPMGMVSRIEGLVEHEDRVVVTMERTHCDRLRHSFWICFDELPELEDFGVRF
ncbi:MAG: hypothetical protein RLP15_01510 [Cryomorphaceae bacterium]